MPKAKKVQAALAIPGFGIRGFDYSRFSFCNPNSVFAVFALDYSRFCYFLTKNFQ